MQGDTHIVLHGFIMKFVSQVDSEYELIHADKFSNAHQLRVMHDSRQTHVPYMHMCHVVFHPIV